MQEYDAWRRTETVCTPEWVAALVCIVCLASAFIAPSTQTGGGGVNCGKEKAMGDGPVEAEN